MTTALVIAALLALYAATVLGRAPTCVMCGGRNAHRDGCPRA